MSFNNKYTSVYGVYLHVYRYTRAYVGRSTTLVGTLLAYYNNTPGFRRDGTSVHGTTCVLLVPTTNYYTIFLGISAVSHFDFYLEFRTLLPSS